MLITPPCNIVMWITLFMGDYIYILHMEDLTFDIDEMDLHRVRVLINHSGNEVGVLYFEKAKKGFVNKPVGMNAWACVDGNLEKLHEIGGESITPKDLMYHCLKLISSL